VQTCKRENVKPRWARPVFTFLLFHVFAIGGLSTPGPRAWAQFPPPAATAPASRPKAAGEFQPGIRIDFPTQTVSVAGRVALDSGPVEFLACFPGKEHESLVLLDASARHVYEALGIAGHAPGKPQTWHEQRQAYDPAEGDLIDVSFRWRDTAGGERQAAAFDWLMEIEFARPALDRPLVFGGSVRLEGGRIAAQASGAGVSIVDMPDALLVPLRAQSSAAAELWAVVRAEAVPKVGTPVTVCFRPATLRQRRAELDFRGDLRLDGRITPLPEFLEFVQANRRISGTYVCRVEAAAALRADVFRFTAALRQAGLNEAVQVVRDAPPASAPASQPAGPR
jgi:hypothetical protein